MTIYQPGEVILAAFPLVAGGTGKVRPSVVLIDSGDADVLVARVTSRTRQTPYDVALADWSGAGLLAPSVVRLHKVATLQKSLVQRTLGALQHEDHQQLSTVLQQMFGSW
jgi:mRNA interferase MazF